MTAQLQHARTLFPRAELDRARVRFASRRDAAYRLLDDASLDRESRRVAAAYMEPFFQAMTRDEAFYLPMIARPGVRLFADVTAAIDACPGAGAAPIGTVVTAPIAKAGSMVQVVALDATWHFVGPAKCATILKGPVWIKASALSTDYPSS